MAHLVETMAYANEAPWHKLGIQVHEDITTDEMLVKAGLNWSINKEPLVTMHTKQTVSEHYGLVRSTDSFVLGHCGKAYKPVQPVEVLGFFNEFVQKGGMKMETAGSLDNGRHIFALASIKESFTLVGSKDKVEGYLLFSSPNVCGKKMRIMFTPVRVVCNNTLTMALENATGRGEFALHHAQKFDADTAKLALGLAKGQLDEFKEASNFLASKQVTEDSLRQYFNVLWPSSKASSKEIANDNAALSNTAEAAMTIFAQQPGANFHPNSWWNAFNTVTYITDHVVGRSDNNRLRRAWFGDGKVLKEEALKLAVEQARAA